MLVLEQFLEYYILKSYKYIENTVNFKEEESMKRKLALILCFTLLVSFLPKLSADNDDLELNAQKLKTQGFLKGDLRGNLRVRESITREQAIIVLIRMMGEEEQAKAAGSKISFRDVKDPYYKPYISYAQQKGWTTGRTNTVFGYNDQVTAEEFSAFMLRALDYGDFAGENFKEVMPLAETLGITKDILVGPKSKLIRGQAFIMMTNTLNTPMKDDDQALIYFLKPDLVDPEDKKREEFKKKNKDKDKKNKVYTGDFKLEDSEATGLKTMILNFSKPVSKSSLGKIRIRQGSYTRPHKALLEEDDTRVYLVLEKKLSQDSKIKISLAGLSSRDGDVLPKDSEVEISVVDTTRPEIKELEAVNPRMLKLTLSEPVTYSTKQHRYLDILRINGKKVYGKVKNDFKNEIMIQLSRTLKPGKTKIEIIDLKDFAGYRVDTKEFEIDIVEDNDAPKLEKVDFISSTRLKAVFNEPLYRKGVFEVDDQRVEGSNIDFNEGDNFVILNLKEQLGLAATVEVRLRYKGQSDFMNNKVDKTITYTFKVEDDKRKPKAELKSVNGNILVIEFNKPMQAKGYFSILKGSRTIVNKRAIKESDIKGNLLKLNLTKLVKGNVEEYTIKFYRLRDASVRQYLIEEIEFEFKSSDTRKPRVTGKYTDLNSGYFVYRKSSDSDYATIRIAFDEVMDEKTLETRGNYMISGLSNSSSKQRLDMISEASIDVENDAKAVIINLPKGMTLSDSAEITLIGLRDKAGNFIDAPHPVITQGGEVPSIKAFEFKYSGRGSDRRKIFNVVFSDPVIILKQDYITLEVGDKKYPIYLDKKDSKNYIADIPYELKIRDDGKTTRGENIVFVARRGAFKSEFDVQNKIQTGELLDLISPSVARTEGVKVSEDKKEILFKFSEPVRNSSTSSGVYVYIKANGRTLINPTIRPSGTDKIAVSYGKTLEEGKYEYEVTIEDRSKARNRATLKGTFTIY